MSDKLKLDPSKIAAVPAKTSKTCHRTVKVELVPQDVQQINPMTKQVMQGVRLDLRPFGMDCVKGACSLWNEEAQECYDVTAAKGAAKTAQQLETLDGYLRLGNPLQAGGA